LLDTNKGGIKNPTAVPTILTATNRERANDLFYCLNHLVAIFIGAFNRKGCPIAQKTWPIITNAKEYFTILLTPVPNKVKTDPQTIPFLIPLTSKTQFDGKFTKVYSIIYEVGIRDTILEGTLYAFYICVDIGVTTTQHIPFIKVAMEYKIAITYR